MNISYYETVFRSLAEGLMVIGPKGEILFVNEAFEKMLGFVWSGDRASVSGRYWEQFRQKRLHEMIEEALALRRGVRGGIEVLFPEERSFYAGISPIGGDDNFEGVVLILHDVTHSKRLERIRSDFVTNVSHELKTPLASILGACETLKGGAMEDPENRGPFLDIIEHQATRLRNLIEDLLNLGQIESGEPSVDKRQVEVAAVAEDVGKALKPLASRKQIALAFDLSRAPQTVPASREKLTQGLINLVDNAIKYTDAGGRVDVSVRVEGKDAVFFVRDTGIGIAPEDQKRIFERFYRVDKSRSREAGGTGLGLSIAKHIAETHGGTLGVESEPEKGSEFYLKIPL